MKLYSMTGRLMVAVFLTLICNTVKAQTSTNRLIGVSYQEASKLNDEVCKILDLVVIRQPREIAKGDYLQGFSRASDSERVDLHIRYGVLVDSGLLDNILISGNKDFLAKIYKTLFDSKFAPKSSDQLRRSLYRGKEAISITTDFEDGSISIRAKD